MWVEITALLSVFGAIFAFLYRKRAEDVARNRQTCSEALAVLLEWLEVPYRIRRRRANDGDGRHELARAIHELQVRTNFYRAWLQVEAPKLSEKYEALHNAVKSVVAPAVQDAWRQPGVSEDAQMNIGSLGAFNIEKERKEFTDGVRREIAVCRLPWMK